MEGSGFFSRNCGYLSHSMSNRPKEVTAAGFLWMGGYARCSSLSAAAKTVSPSLLVSDEALISLRPAG